jgi:hypothetical protein
MHNRDRHWHTADGQLVKVQDMKLGHLVNVINWITDNPTSYRAGTLETMIAEAKFRQIGLFADNQPYPQLVGTRWKIIDPKTGIGKIEKPPADYIEAVKDHPGYQRMSKRTQEIRAKENHDKR